MEVGEGRRRRGRGPFVAATPTSYQPSRQSPIRTIINIKAIYPSSQLPPAPPPTARVYQHHVKHGSSLEKSVVVLVNGNSLQTEPSKAQRPLEHVLVYLQ